MTRPSTRELARQLIEAARADRPPEALARRLRLLAPVPAVLPRAQGMQRARLRARGWVAGCASAAIVVFGWSLYPNTDGPLISREHRAAGHAQDPARPAEQLALPPASERTPHVSAPSGEADAEPTRESKRPVRLAPAPEPAPQQSAPVRSLSREIELLTLARSALGSGEGGRALELLDRRNAERSGPALDAEALLLRIEALSLLGRHSDASDLAQRFVRDDPHNALADRARSFIGRDPTSRERTPGSVEGAR